MGEHDMRGPKRSSPCVGLLDELSFVGRIDHQHARLDAQIVEGLLQIADIFSRKHHSRNIEIQVGVVAEFLEFSTGAQELNAECLAEHRQTFAGVGFVGLELHHTRRLAT